MVDISTSAASPNASFPNLSLVPNPPVLDLVALPPPKPLVDLDLCHSIWVRAPPSYSRIITVLLLLLPFMNLKPIMKLALTFFGRKAMFDELDTLHENRT